MYNNPKFENKVVRATSHSMSKSGKEDANSDALSSALDCTCKWLRCPQFSKKDETAKTDAAYTEQATR